jgi:hypothetical protein
MSQGYCRKNFKNIFSEHRVLSKPKSTLVFRALPSGLAPRHPSGKPHKKHFPFGSFDAILFP